MVARSIAPAFGLAGRAVGQQHVTATGVDCGALFSAKAQRIVFALAAAPGTVVGALAGAAVAVWLWRRSPAQGREPLWPPLCESARAGAAVGGALFLATPSLFAPTPLEGAASLAQKQASYAELAGPLAVAYGAGVVGLVGYYVALFAVPLAVATTRAAGCYAGALVGACVGVARGLHAAVFPQRLAAFTGMADLPVELVTEVARHLDPAGARALSQTCRTLANLELPKVAYARSMDRAPNFFRAGPATHAATAAAAPLSCSWPAVRQDFRRLRLLPDLLQGLGDFALSVTQTVLQPPGRPHLSLVDHAHVSVATARGQLFALQRCNGNTQALVQISATGAVRLCSPQVTAGRQLVSVGDGLVAWEPNQAMLVYWHVDGQGVPQPPISWALPQPVHQVVADTAGRLFASTGNWRGQGSLHAYAPTSEQDGRRTLAPLWQQADVGRSSLAASYGSVFYVQSNQVRELDAHTGALRLAYRPSNSSCGLLLFLPTRLAGTDLVSSENMVLAYARHDNFPWEIWHRGVAVSVADLGVVAPEYRTPQREPRREFGRLALAKVTALGNTLLLHSARGVYVARERDLLAGRWKLGPALAHPALRWLGDLFVMGNRLVASNRRDHGVTQFLLP